MWPTAVELARQIGVGSVSVRAWRRRNSIPVRHWPALVEAARRRGASLDNDVLVRIHASPSGERAA